MTDIRFVVILHVDLMSITFIKPLSLLMSVAYNLGKMMKRNGTLTLSISVVHEVGNSRCDDTNMPLYKQSHPLMQQIVVAYERKCCID